MMHRTMVVAVIAAVLVSAVSAGGVNVSSLSINPGHNKAAKLTLGNADEGFMVKMDPGATGSFQIVHRDNPIFSIDSAGAVMVNGVLNSKGAFKTEGSVSFMGTPQWQLAKIENFEEGAKGWSNQSTTSCGSKMLLGGCEKFIGGETTKTYTGLPEHAQVRLKGNYYMIDSWGGETGYAKMKTTLFGRIAWTSRLLKWGSTSAADLNRKACMEHPLTSSFHTPTLSSRSHSGRPSAAVEARRRSGEWTTYRSTRARDDRFISFRIASCHLVT